MAISPNPFVFWHQAVQPLLILGQDFAPSGLPLGIMSLSWIKKKIMYEKEQGGAEGWGAAPEMLENLCRIAKATSPATLSPQLRTIKAKPREGRVWYRSKEKRQWLSQEEFFFEETFQSYKGAEG